MLGRSSRRSSLGVANICLSTSSWIILLDIKIMQNTLFVVWRWQFRKLLLRTKLLLLFTFEIRFNSSLNLHIIYDFNMLSICLTTLQSILLTFRHISWSSHQMLLSLLLWVFFDLNATKYCSTFNICSFVFTKLCASKV